MMSRSVTTPMGRPVASRIGIWPQLAVAIRRAILSSVVFGEQHTGSAVITSRASLAIGAPFSVGRKCACNVCAARCVAPALLVDQTHGGTRMPEQETLKRARKDKRQ